jgi:hypothetical protein
MFAVLAAACGPGVTDYTERVGNTHYEFSRTGSKSHWLSPRKECGPSCPSIHRNIDRFDWNDQVIAVRRQIVNNFRCDDGSITSLWLNKYEQYVIILATNELVGPMSVAEFQEFQVRNPELLDDIRLLDENSSFDGAGQKLSTLDGCTNPVPS